MIPADVTGALAYVEEHGFGDSVDADSIIEGAVWAVLEALEAPVTDDPLDVLAVIAVAVGLDGFSYFDGRGQWVAYPENV